MLSEQVELTKINAVIARLHNDFINFVAVRTNWPSVFIKVSKTTETLIFSLPYFYHDLFYRATIEVRPIVMRRLV